MMYEQSRRCYVRAKSIGGRSLTRSKAPGKLFGGETGPLYASHGHGAWLYDVDGNAFVDMICALGAISLGYGVNTGLGSTVSRALHNGWIYSLPHQEEGVAAEIVLREVASWASQVRFVKTGSEATHAALLVARRATGRTRYLRLRGSYHGWHTVWQDDAEGVDWLNVGETPTPGDFDQVAALFVEPPRWAEFTKLWLLTLVDRAHRAGVLVVFDEMIYGGRWALGGATEYFGVIPDLACFGKAIGNGAPIACLVGNDALRDHGELVSGTYSGDTAALAACIATLGTYAQQPVIETLWMRGRQLQRGLEDVLAQSGMPAVLEGAPVHQRMRFTEDATLGRKFSARMASRGILWHPDCVNIGFSHSEAQIAKVVEAADASLRELANA